MGGGGEEGDARRGGEGVVGVRKERREGEGAYHVYCSLNHSIYHSCIRHAITMLLMVMAK